jgi:LAO/AO transport system kinase
VTVRRRAPHELLDDALHGDRAATARLLSMVERGGDDARAVARLTHPLTGRARTVGITGAPGAGKSTLTGALIGMLRHRQLRVGVLAIDPSSPLTGGAILGDRVRMQDHATDAGVTIRSMATRGHLGGLSLAAPEAMRVLDAVGFDVVLVETVGVGQVEVDIASRADTTVVVVNPGWGDAIQANKAGLMEVADVFVVNKADRPGADDTRRDLESMLDLAGRTEHAGWRPPVVLTEGTSGRGVAELWAAVETHGTWAQTTGEGERRRQRRRLDELNEIVMRRLEQRARAHLGEQRWEHLQHDVVAGHRDPWSAADELLG